MQSCATMGQKSGNTEGTGKGENNRKTKPKTELPLYKSNNTFSGTEKQNTIYPEWVINTPEKAEIKGYSLTIEVYLWRDFMPVSPPRGKPLKAVFKVIAKGAKGIPGSIRFEQIWVVKDKNEIWNTDILKEQPHENPNEKSVLAVNGPKWDPGTIVETVAEFREGENGTSFFIKASKQIIQRTD